MHAFTATIKKIGINPYVLLPGTVLQKIFKAAGKDKGPIPVHGTINEQPFIQTLVKYSGNWRLYLNTPMRDGTGTGVGDRVRIKLAFDPIARDTPMHAGFEKALNKNKKAKQLFDSLSPYLQKEILRYLNALKTPASVERNIQKALLFLEGRERFIGRDKPA